MEDRIIRTCKRGVLALVACIAATPSLAQTSEDQLTSYVRARAADADGAADVAAAGYAAALANLPDDQLVAFRAYRQGVAAGDYALAARASAALVKGGVAPADTAVLDIAVALDRRDRAAADAALGRMGKGPFGFMAPVISAWMAFDRGEDPVPLLDPARGNALERRFAAENRALLLIAVGRTGEGLAALRPLLAPGRETEDLRIDAALLLAAGRKDGEAAALLAGGESERVALRARLDRRVQPSARFATARMFVSLASQIVDEEMEPLSILLARAALLLDPADDRARLYLGEALSRSGSSRLALGVLGEVAPDSPFARGAAAGSVAALRRAGRPEEAIAHARTLAGDRAATSADARTYGDLLSASGRFAEAAAAYSVAIRRAGGDGGWTLHYLRGKALDRAGKWREALSALRRAVALGPQEADALTYLGSAQVGRGVNLDEAQALLERARAIKPNDAAIADSLALAFLKRGQIDRALPLLEGAAEADPSGSLVNEHLGDAYWRLGRRYEARYAWNAAAVYAENGAATQRIAAKIAGGLAAAN